MSKIFTTSYSDQACNLITALVKSVRPTTAIEIGCQQGRSTVAIAAGLESTARLVSADLFEEKYDAPPYLETHASQEKALENLRASNPICEFEIRKQSDAQLASEIRGNVDLLHVDICNWFGNLEPILNRWQEKVNKMILLEGGMRAGNSWQRKYGFKPWREILDGGVFFAHWDSCTIPFNDHNALTVMTRKQ